ncbi:MAG: alpha-L-fucosidase [Eubacteriales bacterium]
MNKELYLDEINKVIKEGPYKDEWSSLCRYGVADWYRNAKFGIFIHWGVYSVPAFGNEWYPRNVYRKGSPEYKFHVENFGELDKFGYKDFIPMFKAEKFDAKEWAQLFKEAGAKFVMPVAEHHDGFAMYKSELNPWNAADMGPNVDVLGALKQEVEKEDMVICASSHRAEHWWFYNNAFNLESADVQDPANASFYGSKDIPTRNANSIYDNPPSEEYMEDWLVRTCEIVDKYQPKILFFDWWIQQVAWKPYLKKFAAYYYNRSVEWGFPVAINSKFDAFVHGSVVKDIERGQMQNIQPDFWQNDTSVAKNSWCYTEGNDYKQAKEIICDLVDVVSKNGALLLNVGPKSDGTIPEEDKKILQEVGAWLAVNGEAIYDTTFWKIYGEGPTEVPEGHFTDTNREEFTCKDIRYTAKDDYIYATVMKWPEDGVVKLQAFGNNSHTFKGVIKRIDILGYEEAPLIEMRDEMELYSKIQADDKPVVIRINIE